MFIETKREHTLCPSTCVLMKEILATINLYFYVLFNDNLIIKHFLFLQQAPERLVLHVSRPSVCIRFRFCRWHGRKSRIEKSFFHPACFHIEWTCWNQTKLSCSSSKLYHLYEKIRGEIRYLRNALDFTKVDFFYPPSSGIAFCVRTH